MDEQLYDEFGNYIGPELDDDTDNNTLNNNTILYSDSDDEWNNSDAVHNHSGNDAMPIDNTNALTVQDTDVAVGHKQYYPDASAIYGDNVDIRVELEDTQPISTPIIQPIKQTKFSLYETELPTTTYDNKYLAGLLDTPSLVRNIAVVGNLHSGKTSLCDILIEQTHPSLYNMFNDIRHEAKPVRYLDTRVDEQKRELSLKSTPITLLLPTTQGKHYVCNIIDTSGHMNFSDDVTAALPLVDGCIIVIDAVEGCLLHTRNLIKHCIQYPLQFTVCVNKIDRLITDLKLPPDDTYYKLQYIIDEVNSIILESKSPQRKLLSVTDGSVIFASALHSWTFTLPSFAQLYIDQYIPNNKKAKQQITASQLATKFWGNNYYDTTTRKFTDKPTNNNKTRTFVQFILEPLYKLYSHCLGIEGKTLQQFLATLHIHMTLNELKLDYRPLLKLVCQRFFVDISGGLVSSVVQHIPSPQSNARNKLNSVYSGDKTTDVYNSIIQCDRNSNVLLLNTTKAIPRSDASKLDNLARVYSGTLHVGDTVRVLGPAYTLTDREDMSVQTITKIWLLQGRYRIELNRAVAGSIVLLEGIDDVVTKYATITSTDKLCDSIEQFNALQYISPSTMKLILEPVIPSELPKMLYGLRQIDKTYPACITRVEENGEHILLGQSELYLDCMLYDLRRTYATMDIRVTDPIVCYIETCSEKSNLTAVAQTPNKQNRFSIVCEPLDSELIQDLESGAITLHNTSLLESKYKWDKLACRSILSIGPDTNKPNNILINDTLYDTAQQRQLLLSVKDSIISGFQWAIREGPLIEESIYGCLFRIVDAQLSTDPLQRVRGQLIPTVRRALYTSFLLAQPKLMEPIYVVEAICQQSHIAILTKLLQRRRGHIASTSPIVGTPLYTVYAQIPLIDSFGLETDFRLHTHGIAYCSYTFDHWSQVPGDPLDKTVVLVPLEPAPLSCLARDFLVKTRKRKGLGEINISSYIDSAMLEQLSTQNETLQNYLNENNMT